MEFKDLLYLDAKSVQFKVNKDTGLVEGYASTFGNVDEGGDVVVKGAFTEAIASVANGEIKFLSGHDWSPESTLGTVRELSETEVGLFFKAELSSAPSVQDVRTKMIEGHLNRVSIGYQVSDFEYVKNGDVMLRYLKKIKLFEVSVVPFPMNRAAVITGVKSQVSDHPRLAMAGLKKLQYQILSTGGTD